MRIDCIRFLVKCSAKGDIESVVRALDAGVDIDAVSVRGNCTPIEAASKSGMIDVVRLLIEKGASVSTADHLPLSSAALFGHSEIVQLLLEHGADVNACGSEQDGLTALMAAAQAAHLEPAQMLVAANADVDAENGIGHTPLSQARDYEWRYSAYNPVVDLLLDNDASNYGSYKKLKDNPPRPERKTMGKPLDSLGEPLDFNEETVQAPTYTNDYEMGMANKDLVEQLIQAVDDGVQVPLGVLFREKGADANMPHVEEGYTALGYAVQEGNANIVKEFLFFDADPDLGGVISPVHEAISQRRMDILKLLLDAGADPLGLNEGGATPLEVAAAAGSDEAVPVLQHYIDHPPK